YDAGLSRALPGPHRAWPRPLDALLPLWRGWRTTGAHAHSTVSELTSQAVGFGECPGRRRDCQPTCLGWRSCRAPQGRCQVPGARCLLGPNGDRRNLSSLGLMDATYSPYFLLALLDALRYTRGAPRET